MGLPGVSVLENPPINAGDMSLIPGSGRSPRKGNGNPLQYSCLKNPMNRGAWRATVHKIARVGHNLQTKQQQVYYNDDKFPNTWFRRYIHQHGRRCFEISSNVISPALLMTIYIQESRNKTYQASLNQTCLTCFIPEIQRLNQVVNN